MCAMLHYTWTRFGSSARFEFEFGTGPAPTAIAANSEPLSQAHARPYLRGVSALHVVSSSCPWPPPASRLHGNPIAELRFD